MRPIPLRGEPVLLLLFALKELKVGAIQLGVMRFRAGFGEVLIRIPNSFLAFFPGVPVGTSSSSCSYLMSVKVLEL